MAYSVFNKKDSNKLNNALAMEEKKKKLQEEQRNNNLEKTAKILEEKQRTGDSPETIQKTAEAMLGPASEKESTTLSTGEVPAIGANMSEETPVEPEQPEADTNKHKYGKSMYGILDALKAGDIDKGTAAYFMLDALSKTSRNIGKDIGNVGAQFTGGTIDNNYDQSLWNERRENMFENEQTSELNKQEGTDKALEYEGAKLDVEAKKFANKSTEYKLNAAKMFDEKAKSLAKTNPKLANIYSLLAAGATSDLGMESYIAAWFADNPESDTKETRQQILDILGQYGK